MLHLIVWISIYALILLALGRLTERVRLRFWFKLLFLPGGLLSACAQLPASYLCFGGRGKFHPLRAGVPVYEPPAEKVAVLPGALYVVLTHGVLFGVFAFAAALLERWGLLDVHGLELPNLYPYELAGGVVYVQFGPYLSHLAAWLSELAREPIRGIFVLYGSFAFFIPASLGTRAWRRAAFLLLVAGACAYIGGWLGSGFRFLSRGWWAGFFYFPSWWAVFSTYVTLAGVTLGAVVVLRLALRLFKGAAERARGGTAKKRGAARRQPEREHALQS